MAAKLNQVLAIEKGTKPKCNEAITNIHKLSQKGDLFYGEFKSYKAQDEAGEKLAPVNKKVQLSAEEVFKTYRTAAEELFNTVARKDWSNTVAKANVVLDGKIILENVPVTYLLFMEKQLQDAKTLIAKIPVLDEAEDWVLDPNSKLFKTKPVETHRTNKIQEPLTLAPATDRHPAQVQLITKDVITGFWTTIRSSGALPKPRKEELLARVEKLANAVKTAREAANMVDEVTSPDVGAVVFGYLLA